MLTHITLLTCYLFAVIYPLCFWISNKDPLKNNFHRFHLGLPCIISGLVLIFIYFLNFSSTIRILTFAWFIILFFVSGYFWKKEYPSAQLVTIPSIIGLSGYISLSHSIMPGSLFIFSGILGGFIFSSVLFAMNLGHWYLNVHGLPIKHLKNATQALVIFLGMRLAWDIGMIIFGSVAYNGENIGVHQFLMTIEGFLLLVGVLFGTLLPLGGTYFVLETIKLKNTQSSTGILYVLLCSVLLGDMTYKYFALKYGVYL